jgi:hypothetical protein
MAGCCVFILLAGLGMNENASMAAEIISGDKARRAAGHMDMGNIVAMIIPVPIGMLWFGLSMLVYAMHRHHPNPKVGHYTQWAAYRFYGVMGTLVPVATFFPGSSLKLWLATWAISAAIVIPSSIWALIRIRRDTWEDTVVPVAGEAADA